MYIAELLVPLELVTTIVSLVPTFVVNAIALASSVLDDKSIWPPDISIFLPAEASISIPPDVDCNFKEDSSVPLALPNKIVSLLAVVLAFNLM